MDFQLKSPWYANSPLLHSSQNINNRTFPKEASSLFCFEKLLTVDTAWAGPGPSQLFTNHSGPGLVLWHATLYFWSGYYREVSVEQRVYFHVSDNITAICDTMSSCESYWLFLFSFCKVSKLATSEYIFFLFSFFLNVVIFTSLDDKIHKVQ